MIELIRSDCVQWMRGQPTGSVDCVITSPPYNLGIEYSTYGDDRQRGEYLDWLRSVFVETKRVLTEEGSFFLNVGYSNKDPWIGTDIGSVARDLFVLQNPFNWIKSVTVNGRTHGHFKPIGSKRFVHLGHEFVFHFTKTGRVTLDRLAIGVPYEWESNITRFNKTKPEEHNLRCRGNTWFIPYDTIQDRAIDRGRHPATFPVALPEMCIKIAALPYGSLVYDPFAGTGTTLIAAKKLGMRAVGTDVDADYLAYAKRRLSSLEREL